MIALNIWHYLSFSIGLIILVLGIIVSLKQKNKKLVMPMIFSVVLVTVVMGVFSVFIVDKYTKSVELYKLKNKRLLSVEKIIYSGVVKNTGDYSIGEVKFEIKLVNQGNAMGINKGGGFFKPSGFFDFFSMDGKQDNKVNSIKKVFVVAKDLKPGESKYFTVRFPFPPYFRQVSENAKVYGH
jgi:hypothetical protein